jgi:hypothetical protein
VGSGLRSAFRRSPEPAWLAALLLTLARRTPRAVVALAACPTLLLAIFLALPD